MIGLIDFDVALKDRRVLSGAIGNLLKSYSSKSLTKRIEGIVSLVKAT